jgi:hypothetical protein
LGAVKEDIHKHEHQYKQINFSDVNCIKGLIKNRWMIDTYRGIETNNNIYEAGNVTAINQELICLFSDLDRLIVKTKLNEKQLTIINMLMDGNNEEDIAEHFGQDSWRIVEILDTVTEKIKRVNDYEWKYYNVYLNYLKVEWDYKTCSKCGESKPQTIEFFSPDKRKKDGLYSHCKECDRSK